jgi:hypothetical protein
MGRSAHPRQLKIVRNKEGMRAVRIWLYEGLH